MAKKTTATTAPQTEQDAAAPSDRPILVWEAKEFTEYDRNKRWYLIVGIIGALLTVAMLVAQWWLPAVVFALATFVVIRHADDPARTMTYAITKLGLQIGDNFRPYNELKSYWIIYKPPIKTLYVQSTNRFKPLLKMDLAEIDPLAVKNALKDYLPEETKREEDFIEKFSRFIRL